MDRQRQLIRMEKTRIQTDRKTANQNRHNPDTNRQTERQLDRTDKIQILINRQKDGQNEQNPDTDRQKDGQNGQNPDTDRQTARQTTRPMTPLYPPPLPLVIPGMERTKEEGINGDKEGSRAIRQKEGKTEGMERSKGGGRK